MTVEGERWWFFPEKAPSFWFREEVFEEKQALCPDGVPAAALAFKAAVHSGFDVLLDGTGASFDSGVAALFAALWEAMPVVDTLAITGDNRRAAETPGAGFSVASYALALGAFFALGLTGRPHMRWNSCGLGPVNARTC